VSRTDPRPGRRPVCGLLCASLRPVCVLSALKLRARPVCVLVLGKPRFSERRRRRGGKNCPPVLGKAVPLSRNRPQLRRAARPRASCLRPLHVLGAEESFQREFPNNHTTRDLLFQCGNATAGLTPLSRSGLLPSVPRFFPRFSQGFTLPTRYMVSKVKSRSFHAEDFFLLFSVAIGSLWLWLLTAPHDFSSGLQPEAVPNSYSRSKSAG
jgi:hypothetical protein